LLIYLCIELFVYLLQWRGCALDERTIGQQASYHRYMLVEVLFEQQMGIDLKTGDTVGTGPVSELVRF
jgi:hypothetical protein